MGGDGGVATTVAAAVRFASLADLTLVGDAPEIQAALTIDNDSIDVQHAGEV